MSHSMHRLMLWSGPFFAVVMVIAFVGMGFTPPLKPSMSATEIAAVYEQHRTGIRFGAMLVMQMGVLGLLWSAGLASQIRRIEAPAPPLLAHSQMLLGVFTFFVFIIASVMWTVAAFRPERDPELVLMLNDLGWLGLLMPVSSGTLQAIIIGIAIFSDRREHPLFPRWAGYFNLWCALLFLPGALATFFKTDHLPGMASLTSGYRCRCLSPGLWLTPGLQAKRWRKSD